MTEAERQLLLLLAKLTLKTNFGPMVGNRKVLHDLITKVEESSYVEK